VAPNAGRVDEMQLLAILGMPADLGLVRQIAHSIELGPQRFGILASYGHPEIMNDLLEALMDPDAQIAAAAGQAFSRITGVNIESDRRVELPTGT
jgi:hypothetical protein